MFPPFDGPDDVRCRSDGPGGPRLFDADDRTQTREQKKEYKRTSKTAGKAAFCGCLTIDPLYCFTGKIAKLCDMRLPPLIVWEKPWQYLRVQILLDHRDRFLAL